LVKDFILLAIAGLVSTVLGMLLAVGLLALPPPEVNTGAHFYTVVEPLATLLAVLLVTALMTGLLRRGPGWYGLIYLLFYVGSYVWVLQATYNPMAEILRSVLVGAAIATVVLVWKHLRAERRAGKGE
jgi:hypothetical protein